MTRIASIWQGKDGYTLRISDIPLRSLVMEAILEDVVIPATFHVLCCRIGEWEFKLGWGKRDEDGIPENNLGRAHYQLGNKISWWTAHRQNELYRMPLDSEIVREKFPDSYFDPDADNADEDEDALL